MSFCRVGLWRAFPSWPKVSPRQQGNLVAIHFVSRILTCIPTSRLAATALMLSSRSQDMNCGCFHLDAHDCAVSYHVSFPLIGKPAIERFFDLALQQSVFHIEEHFGFLCSFCFDTDADPAPAECPRQSPAIEPLALTFPGNLDYHSAWVIGRSSQGKTLNATTKPKNTYFCCPNDGNKDEGTWLFHCKKHELFCEQRITGIRAICYIPGVPTYQPPPSRPSRGRQARLRGIPGILHPPFQPGQLCPPVFGSSSLELPDALCLVT